MEVLTFLLNKTLPELTLCVTSDNVSLWRTILQYFRVLLHRPKGVRKNVGPGFVVLFFLIFFAPLPKQKIIFMAPWRVTDLEISDFVLFHFIA